MSARSTVFSMEAGIWLKGKAVSGRYDQADAQGVGRRGAKEVHVASEKVGKVRPRADWLS